MKTDRNETPLKNGAPGGESPSSPSSSLPPSGKGKPRWLASRGRKSLFGSPQGCLGRGLGKGAGIVGPWPPARKTRVTR